MPWTHGKLKGRFRHLVMVRLRVGVMITFRVRVSVRVRIRIGKLTKAYGRSSRHK